VCNRRSVMRSQTGINLTTQANPVVDFGGATFTRPIRIRTILPAVCSTGELFFKSDAPPGSNIYGCAATNQWAPPTAGSSGEGAGLPSLAGNEGKSLWTDGVFTTWKSFTTGGTGELELLQSSSEISLDIVSAVVPQKAAANDFTGLNSFHLGIQLTP
jgi:hypothetical protein